MLCGERYQTSAGICVHRIGSEAVDPPGFTIDRPRGSGDYDFIHFSTPVTVLAAGKRMQALAGTCILYAPDSPQWYTGGSRSYCHDWFHFDGPGAAALVARFAVPTNRLLHPRTTRFITDMVRAMCLEIAQKQECWQDAVITHLCSLFVQLRRALGSPRAGGHGTSRVEAHLRLGDARLAVMEKPEEPWTVARMARIACLSRSRFCALYRERFGVSPREDVIRTRLHQARWLIENGGLSKTGNSQVYKCRINRDSPHPHQGR